MKRIELNLAERRTIENLLHLKVNVTEIARQINRHRSTVYREIKRNFYKDEELPQLDGYYGMNAQKFTAERRARRRKLVRIPELRDAVIERLQEGWSPEQIAGRLQLRWPIPGACTVSSRSPHDRKPRHARTARGMMFPLERSIHNRPEHIKDRSTFGDWEGDLMIFRREHGKANVASRVERKTRYAVLFRNNDRSSTHFMAKLMNVMEPLPQTARKSITFDRGIEFSGWRKLKPGIGTEAWFCDPQAPWQKGSVENLNKRARRYLPRDTPITALSNRDMKAICNRFNSTPRKCLGWKTPTEAFAEELRKLR